MIYSSKEMMTYVKTPSWSKSLNLSTVYLTGIEKHGGVNLASEGIRWFR